jgi:enterochelin esterase-like enzyme
MMATLARRVTIVACCFCIASLVLPAPASADEGRIVIESVKNRPVITYLPPSYDSEAERRYPVIYLLHGGGGAPRSFIEGNYSGLNIRTTMNNLVTLHIVREMIIVMPDINNVYRDFIVKDVIPYIDSTYRTLAKRESRGIGGHSRGGCGSFLLATDHPELFSALYGLAASCLDRETEKVEGSPDQGMREPLASRMAELKDSIKNVTIAFDVGLQDNLLRANQNMAVAMERAGVKHVFETYPGDHNGGVRQRIASKLLPFFSRELATQ